MCEEKDVLKFTYLARKKNKDYYDILSVPFCSDVCIFVRVIFLNDTIVIT
jgi:hypothetical protein